ncbi:ATP-binding sensor histidine kinase [Aulosira sp. FACHB-615]|uniref:ATP-binding sensor histidine kinase n=1 Tax=Aulosira sp. FACHB-615 TaxID=2692777 RepID=UPI001687E4DB|nr:ATP-binding sensor histidine kinase [Aulosira sp. FACHB-615]MBD2488503.1 AAA family ATPase [Aulosira sp. FACHB-615]
MIDTLVKIPGYRISEELYNGSRTLVYRAVRESDSIPVVIKLLKNPYPSFSELLLFRNQYTIGKNLNSPLIIQTYSLEPLHNGYMLVMEDFGGISLKDYFSKNQGLASLEEFLILAIALCDTLNLLYHERIIHKDIKPSNILINPETKQIKLIDFSIASLLPRETQTLVNPNVLEGTLAYISPEQTGRMNRGIDYRTDFYSLGVTFYEFLTGELPFSSNDAMELVHSHIAKIPPLLHAINRDIPSVISEIVSKLMAKNAEDRYQSALGLKFDLEKCLTQLRETGEIQSFAIASRDLCDRFIIPDKLYGRETEVNTLLEAFERVSQGTTEMMLVAGFSGIGKTAVVNEVHKPIVRQRGYFIKGKYDQFNRNIPFSAFVQAFRDLMGQLLTESDVQIEQWKHKILEAVGENGQVIIEVIPELENIIGAQLPVVELSGAAAENRFNLLFQKFTQIFTTKEHPLVIFLDDLQWADSASLKLIQLLIANTGHLFIIGAYRDNEVNPGHPLLLTLGEIQKTQTKINTITLAALSQVQVNKLAADTLKCPEDVAWNLSVLIYQKTQGNPFFTTQLLKALHQDKLIQFDFELGCWQCDISQVSIKVVTDDVVAFMSLQLRKLPPSTQEILQLAACIGNSFDLATLAIVSQQSQIETAACLWKALQEGLILPISDVYKFYIGTETLRHTSENQQIVNYKFLHDRVQQAAYSLIPDEQKQATHYQIGQLLLSKISPEDTEERIFELVGQLNHGQTLMSEQHQRDDLARLNLIAARKARTTTAYQGGREYVRVGLSLLGETAWQRQYEITLAFYELAAELASLCGDYAAMESVIETVIEQAQSVLEKVNVYRIRIVSLISQNKLLESIEVARNVLALLGLPLPETMTEADFPPIIAEVNQLIGERDIEDLVHLPRMSDRRIMAIVEIMTRLFSSAYISGSSLYVALVTIPVKLSIEYGNTLASIAAYSCYSIIVANFLQDVNAGVKFNQLAIQLTSALEAKVMKPEAFHTAGLFTSHRKFHIRDILPLVQEGYTTGLEVGNIEYVGYNAHAFCANSFWCGRPLDTLEPEIRAYHQALVQMSQLTPANWCRVYWQGTLNLLGDAESPHIFAGEAIEETEFLSQIISARDLLCLYAFYVFKLMLCCLFDEVETARIYAVEVKRYFNGGVGTLGEAEFYFYDSLTVLATLRQGLEERSPLLQQVEENQTKLQQQWANYAPMNHQHKFDLVEAERYGILGKYYEAGDWYDRAISGAKANGYIQEEALANELAAKFYLDWGKEKIAAGYIQEAYYCYARWGAKAKIADLEIRYPQLLAPILQQSRSVVSTNETIFTVGTVTKSSSSASSSSVSHTLDLTAILKASQTISGEIELEKLLSSLLSIVIENAGADKCVLMLLQDNNLLIQGSITQGSEPIVLQSLPIADSQDIPHKLIYKVKNNQQTVVLLDANADITFANDPYIIRQQPQSVLCSPILNQGKLLGILYLENNLVTGAFKSDRVEILNLLCSQAAISLENARLYQLSQKSKQQLERSLDELSAAQLRLQASGKRLQLLVEQTPLAVIEWDTNFCVTDWNPAAERIFGYTKQEALGRQLQFIIPPTIQIQIDQIVCNLLSQQGGNYKINENITKDGKTIICAWYNNPLVNADGELIGVASLADDITERQLAAVQLQQKAQELEQALQDLQQAQLQMVQTEKMSALGNLVAGVAHEMNNPLGFIAATLKQAKPTFADIIEHLKIYQETLPDKTEEILDHEAEIDLEYTIEDLPKMLDSMTMACDRLKNISTSLRTFSRADRDYKVPFNLHEGIDSTILILKHRLKANEQRPAIEVVTNYANLPQLECFPGQLNQVFMNILANAIDALDESNHGRSFAEIQAHPNQITITTSIADKFVKISIADNGKGMSAEVKHKIFDHLFTTKGVCKGTGLGLAIARQIIEEKHGGKITVNSILGEGTEFIISLPII